MIKVFGASDVKLAARDFDARASFAKLSEVAIAFASIDVDLELRYPEANYYRLQFALSGNGVTSAGSVSTEIRNEQACVTSPNQASKMFCAGGHARMTLRIDAAAMRRKLGALIGGLPAAELELEPALDINNSRVQGLLQFTSFLAGVLNSDPVGPGPLALRELEQAIVVSALTASRHAYSDMLEGNDRDAAPLHVRIVEEFIEANWNRAVSIDELSAATGVNARTLFRSFKKLRSCTPMQFARLVRLRRARDMLSAPDDNTTVIGTALACGFMNPGHFARYYQEAFGELPSKTLACRS